MLQTPFGKLGKFILGSSNHLHPVSQPVKGWVFLRECLNWQEAQEQLGGGGEAERGGTGSVTWARTDAVFQNLLL